MISGDLGHFDFAFFSPFFFCSPHNRSFGGFVDLNVAQVCEAFCDFGSGVANCSLTDAASRRREATGCLC